MTYKVVRQNGQYIQEPYHTRIVNAYLKDKTTMHFNMVTVTIDGASVLDGVTVIRVSVV